LEVDNARVRASQIARIEKVRASRDEERVRSALDNLTEAGKKPVRAEPVEALPFSSDEQRAALRQAQGERNLLGLAVECARARCTLGEISDALERAFGRYGTVPEPVRGIYGKA